MMLASEATQESLPEVREFVVSTVATCESDALGSSLNVEKGLDVVSDENDTLLTASPEEQLHEKNVEVPVTEANNNVKQGTKSAGEVSEENMVNSSFASVVPVGEADDAAAEATKSSNLASCEAVVSPVVTCEIEGGQGDTLLAASPEEESSKEPTTVPEAKNQQLTEDTESACKLCEENIAGSPVASVVPVEATETPGEENIVSSPVASVVPVETKENTRDENKSTKSASPEARKKKKKGSEVCF